MAVRVTDSAHVALYDSTTGVAFGPTFDSADHAEDFLRWWGETNPNVGPPSDYPERVLVEDHAAWMAARCDEDGYLLERSS